ncbi:ABC transporter ATP-binding protein [Clostridium sp.]|uniref:ABC transporter ATP-binding protein n=1 Tax=Clostridium sp. TaxID=1506 RepID=UPI002A7F9DAE|nr:ABC transporter ATP-binding protein [Clostridium sp.]MDY4251244.1 ABC transporter ATP-binding protein [Clostridium sp.]
MRIFIFKYKKSFIVTSIFTIILASLSVYFAFILQNIIDLAEKGDINSFIKGILILVFYCIISLIIEIIQTSFLSIYKKKTMQHIKETIFNGLMKKDIKSFSEENSAKYMSILTNDINMIEQDGLNTIFSLIKDSFMFVISIVSVIYLSIPITIAIFILTLISFIVPQLFSKNIAKKREDYSHALESFTSKTKDILSGFEVIKNFNIINKISNLYLKSNTDVENKHLNFNLYSGIINAISSNLGALVFTAPIAIGGYFVIKGDITTGVLIALIQLMNNIIGPIATSSIYINRLKSLNPIIKKIEKIIKDDIKEEFKYKLESFNEKIEINNVNFTYDGKKNVLKDINLTFEKGKKYALVGTSGCGKSTILKLILRYYDNFDGMILIDGKDYSDINANDMYKHISVLQQHVFMFDGTIKDNIGLYGDYSDQDIIEKANMAGLSALINNLPKGIYEEVGENGCKLSGGEKQRIAIARALMKNSSIMLLDESTSSLDNETAYSIEKLLLALDGITSIVITHKLMKDVLINYDEIIVMRDGSIVEKGSFNDLIDKKSYFYSLYTIG